MSEQGSHLTDKGTEPFSTANIDDVLGSPMYWIEHIATTVSTDTPLPKSFEHDYSDVSRGLTKSSSLTSVSPSSLFSPTKGTTDNQTSISALQEDSGEKEAGRAEGVANFPRDESKGQGSFSSTFRPPATLSESSINPSSLDYIKTAIPLFKNMTRVQDGVKASVSGNLPNPLASSLARDSMLIYARRMFHMPPVPPGLDENARQERIKDVYRTQLLPLLRNLHSLHPRHIPILLLLGCVYYAIGDFAESLAVNNEILRIDEKFVSEKARFRNDVDIRPSLGRSYVKHRHDVESDGTDGACHRMLVESRLYSTNLLGCSSKDKTETRAGTVLKR